MVNFNINNREVPINEVKECNKQRKKIENEISKTINKLINSGEKFPDLVLYGTPDDRRRHEAFEKFLLNLSGVKNNNNKKRSYKLLNKKMTENEKYKELLRQARNYKEVYNTESVDAYNIKTLGNLFLKSLYSNIELINPLLYLYFQEYIELLRECKEPDSKSVYNFKLYCLEPFFRVILLNYEDIDCKKSTCSLLEKILNNTNNFNINIFNIRGKNTNEAVTKLTIGNMTKYINLEMKTNIIKEGLNKSRRYTYCFNNFGISSCYNVVENNNVYTITNVGDNMEPMPIKILSINNSIYKKKYISKTIIEYKEYKFKYLFYIENDKDKSSYIILTYTPKGGKEKELLTQKSFTRSDINIDSKIIDGVRKSNINIKGISKLESTEGIRYTEPTICGGLLLCLLLGSVNTIF